MASLVPLRNSTFFAPAFAVLARASGLVNESWTSVPEAGSTRCSPPAGVGPTANRTAGHDGIRRHALLVLFLLSAVRMLESGFASRDDIDQGLVHGAAHPQGPLALADLIGLDTTKAVADSLYEEYKEPLYAAPPLLARMVDAGLLGRKSGQGFYIYS